VRFVVDKVALGQIFSEFFRFSLPIFIPPIAPQSPPSIIWGLYNRPVVAAVPSGLSPTPLIKKINRVDGIQEFHHFYLNFAVNTADRQRGPKVTFSETTGTGAERRGLRSSVQKLILLFPVVEIQRRKKQLPPRFNSTTTKTLNLNSVVQN
jgi:hypothetical protein